ncbi:60 kDa lysophospholipase isoform X1 [Phascolarctos cinereus]|uniref:asparaginase n=1 Tax=Phascolarctos cinereus TaxID=38626 RepID=A0A6P5J0P7_PHACI|nr:60 kDa lysophospholipase isoform X1 [Phascolarctos cinereus]
MARSGDPVRRLLAIYTGGTIGMRSREGVLVPGSNLLPTLRKLPMFNDEEYSREHQLPADTLALPLTNQNQRILYTILEYDPLFDSSDMTINEWIRIAKDIERNYEQYFGFVIIHGTDTMAFASSMLSFILGNLQKTVILTGAQVPIHTLWNDGRENLLGGLLMAGHYVIPEVCLFFQNQLYRGNRVTKVDSQRFAAFCSPNLPPLATVGADITVNRELILKASMNKQLVVHSSMERNVGVLRLYPGITAAMVKAFLQPPMKGVVMETFGTGNGPTNPGLLWELKKATESGMVIVNCTHCLQGSVTSEYATGMALSGIGIISGSDMTSEAALAKLSYVLGREDLSLEDKKKLLTKNLRGEMTPLPKDVQVSLRDSKFVQVIANLLYLNCSQDLDAVRDSLTPTLACAAARIGDMEALEVIIELGGNLSESDFDGRTPLHMAARGGHVGAVQCLLRNGAKVNSWDGDRSSPLLMAIKGRHKDVIRLLRDAGAHLSPQELQGAGTELCRLAASGDRDGLIAWQQAGVDLFQTGYDGQTPLQVAEAAGNHELVSLLRAQGMEARSDIL